jgi:hypothetical protein
VGADEENENGDGPGQQTEEDHVKPEFLHILPFLSLKNFRIREGFGMNMGTSFRYRL